MFQKKRIPLSKIKTPFIYVEDEKGGHCPFGWSKNDDYEEWDCITFFKDYGKKDPIELKERYKKGIKRSADIFHERIKTIKNRGILDEKHYNVHREMQNLAFKN